MEWKRRDPTPASVVDPSQKDVSPFVRLIRDKGPEYARKAFDMAMQQTADRSLAPSTLQGHSYRPRSTFFSDYNLMIF